MVLRYAFDSLFYWFTRIAMGSAKAVKDDRSAGILTCTASEFPESSSALLVRQLSIENLFASIPSIPSIPSQWHRSGTDFAGDRQRIHCHFQGCGSFQDFNLGKESLESRSSSLETWSVIRRRWKVDCLRLPILCGEMLEVFFSFKRDYRSTISKRIPSIQVNPDRFEAGRASERISDRFTNSSTIEILPRIR